MKQILSLILILGISTMVIAQHGTDNSVDDNLVQLSGLILIDNGTKLEPVPYATVAIKGAGRGTYSDFKGFFSIVVHRDDVIQFSGVGYEQVTFNIPDTLSSNRYSIVQLMTTNTVNIPETVIFPWPDRDHFKVEFLAMDVNTDLSDKARQNLAEQRIAAIRANTKMDANENSDYYLRQTSQDYYHIGQAPPMNIFNPIAWGKFFKAWKNGDFKKK